MTPAMLAQKAVENKAREFEPPPSPHASYEPTETQKQLMQALPAGIRWMVELADY